MRAWSLIGMLVIVAVCVVNSLQTLRRVPPPSRHAAEAAPPDAVIQQERRFAQLRQALDGHGVSSPVGYLTDIPPDQLAEDHAAMREYLISQFVLVPWVIDGKKADCAWMIGNFHRGDARAAVPTGFRVARDFGEGVLLLQKVAP